MTDQEKITLIKAINSCFVSHDPKCKKEILWQLLQETITEDPEGIKWLYFELEKFIKLEFGD